MGAGMRTRVAAPDAKQLTRRMNEIGRAARPVFREAGERVAQVAARDLQSAARGFSDQSKSLAQAIEAKRDRVPYVAVKRGGIYRLRGSRRRDAVRAGSISKGSEYGMRTRNVFVAPRHGGTPQRWKPGGYWWNPTIGRNLDRYDDMWREALGKILDSAIGRL